MRELGPGRHRVRPGRLPRRRARGPGRAAGRLRPAAPSAASCRCCCTTPATTRCPEVDAFIDGCLACGAGVVVLAAFTGVDGYDDRPVLDDDGLGDAARQPRPDRRPRDASRGVAGQPAPARRHHGRDRRGDRAGARRLRVGLCVDTGHLVVGGADPVALTATHPERVVHVHLKDVDGALAEQVVDGELAFGDAVRTGMFRAARPGRRRHRCHGAHPRGTPATRAGTSSSRT